MIFIQAFLFFILGFIFSQWFAAIFESLSKAVCIFIEAKTIKNQLLIHEANLKIQKSLEEQQKSESSISAIGFSVPAEEDEDYDEDF